jgi:hypothetical protein
MRKLALVSLLMLVGCGGGSSGSKDTGPVDPDSLDFCLQWANGVCRLAYLCTDAAAQDATFHARFGASMDDCWEGLERRCTSNQTGSQAFGPSCGPSKTVNDAAAQTCNDGLDSQSCTTWTAAPAGPCDAVCSATASGGTSSGGTGSGGAGSGGTGTGGAGNGSIATASQYCATSGNLSCDRYFECDAATAAATFGNLAGCRSLIASSCSDNPCPTSYDPALGASCIAAAKAATCAELMGPAPTVCTSACN